MCNLFLKTFSLLCSIWQNTWATNGIAKDTGKVLILRGQSDHTGTDIEEWPEGEGEFCRADPKLQTICHGDRADLSDIYPFTINKIIE